MRQESEEGDKKLFSFREGFSLPFLGIVSVLMLDVLRAYSLAYWLRSSQRLGLAEAQ